MTRVSRTIRIIQQSLANELPNPLLVSSEIGSRPHGRGLDNDRRAFGVC